MAPVRRILGQHKQPEPGTHRVRDCEVLQILWVPPMEAQLAVDKLRLAIQTETSQQALALVVSSAGAEWRSSGEPFWHARRSTLQEDTGHGLCDGMPRSGAGMALCAVRQAVFLASCLRQSPEFSQQGPDEKLGRGLVMPDMSNRVPFTGAATATSAMRSTPLCAGSPRWRAAGAPRRRS